MNLNYSINGVSFKQLGIYVSDSQGVLDGLELKEPFSVDWPDANGEVVDLTRPRWQKREIKLDCFMVAPTADAFVSQWSAFLSELIKTGTQRLRINPIDSKPLVYEVYVKGAIEPKKKWRDTAMVGEFTLGLTEPQPVKWVLSGQGGQTVNLVLSAVTPINLYWGDGSVETVLGSNQTYSHTYGGSSSVTYYLIVSGELQRMTVHSRSTNLTELWPRLY